ncbi:MAG: hypothetical protein PWP08_952 [Methanofollis sp.]|nr:hypothetical protein [Methanofollis sp.]
MPSGMYGESDHMETDTRLLRDVHTNTNNITKNIMIYRFYVTILYMKYMLKDFIRCVCSLATAYFAGKR